MPHHVRVPSGRTGDRVARGGPVGCARARLGLLLAALALALLAVPAQASAVLAPDDFNRCTMPGSAPWTLIDPVGDGSAVITGAGGGDARLSLSVPAGTSHDPDGVNGSLRLVQPAPNADLTAEARFLSTPARKFQMQGILVKHDEQNFLRFELYSDGSRLRAYTASVTGGDLTARGTRVVSPGPGAHHLRVEREGDSWTFHHSFDGVTWTTVASFTHALAVSGAGPYAGNFGSGTGAPAYTAVVDYFSGQAGPPPGEDAGPPPGTAGLTVATSGAGTVTRDPAAPHACDSTVALTAVPDPGSRFAGWSGDLTGTAATESLTLDGSTPKAVTATFVADIPGPEIGAVAVAPAATAAAVTWTTDVPADSRVDHGTSPAYELGAVTAPGPSTAHQVELTGLSPGTPYHYRVTSTGAEGVATSTGDLTFTTAAAPASDPIASDDFNRCTAPGSGPWTVVDPVGDGSADIVGAGGGDAFLTLALPGGTSHDLHPGNNSLRLLQSASDTDFEVEARFASVPSARLQMQGILVEEDADSYLRFEFFSDGSRLRIYSATVLDGVSRTNVNKAIPAASELYLRVERLGDTWTQRYSRDGVIWVTGASFTQPLTPARVGPYAGNFGAPAPAPAFTALVDYFANRAAPIANEDGTPAGDAALDVTVVGAGTVTRDPAAPHACGASVTLTATPAAGAHFDGFAGDLTGATSPQTLTLDGPRAVTASFGADEPPPAISAVQAEPGETSATIRWSTDRPASSRVDHGTSPAYELGAVSDPALVTAHTLSLTGLAPDTLYHYRVTSVDADGRSAQSEDLTFRTLAPPADASGIRSDDFNAPNLDTGVWSLVNPVGDGTVALTGTGTADAELELGVPAGVSHVPVGDNRAVRILQASNDTDLQVRAAFASVPTTGFQMQGIMVQQTPTTWLRFELFSDGTSLRTFAASYSGGTQTTRANTVVSGPQPRHLRVSRVGDAWTQEVSVDGTTWTVVAGFTQALTVTAVGPYAGNHTLAGAPPPAYTAAFDYFENTAAPIVGEDQGTPVDTLPPLVHAIRPLASDTGVQVEWATDEPATRAIRYGTTTAYELGTVSTPGTGRTHAVTIGGLQPSTQYHLQVVSADAGGRSSASGDITVTTGADGGGPEFRIFGGDTLSFGQPGLAQRFLNVQGNVSDADGVASLTYSLNGGPQRALSLGPDNRRLELPGDFNADIPIADTTPGANTVVLRATDGLGNATTGSVTLDVTRDATWPLPYSVDWSAAATIDAVAQVVDGLWRLDAGGLRTGEIGYDRLVAIGDTAWEDYEVTVPVTVHSIDRVNGNPFPSNGPGVGIFTRWQGHSPVDGTQPMWGFYPAGAFAYYTWQPDGTERFEINAQGVARDTSPRQFPIGATYMFKFRVETQADGLGRYQFRAWPAGQPEPTGWDVELSGANDLPTGSVLLVAHHADVTFGDLSVVPL